MSESHYCFIFFRDRLTGAVTSEEGKGLTELLRMLELVMRTPALSTTSFTQIIVELGLRLTDQLVSENVCPPVQEAYYRLVFR